MTLINDNNLLFFWPTDLNVDTGAKGTLAKKIYGNWFLGDGERTFRHARTAK